MELTPWQRLLELAYPLDATPAIGGREAVVDVLQLLRDGGHIDDAALGEAVDTVARLEGMV